MNSPFTSLLGPTERLTMPEPTRWTGPFRMWGTVRPEDDDRHLTCDDRLPDPDQILIRSIEVDAPVDVAWRWLCQLREAPYSWDLIDNLGRRSPRTLTTGADELEVGQSINTIFRIVSFVDGESITIRFASRWFGEVVCTYAVVPDGPDTSRYLVRFLVRYARTWPAAAMSWLLPGGDLVMMAKQLRTLAELAATDG